MSIAKRVITKRTLVAVSHAIERFALAGGADQPTVVIAMFQRLSYFNREVEMYRRIAAQATVTLVGLVEDLPPALPPGVSHVLLTEDEPLAREWSVTVLSPAAGATLVALDRETVTADAATLEAGREFEGGWSFVREHAYAEIMRLRGSLSDRLSPTTVTALDDVIRRVVGSAGSSGESRADAALRHLAKVADASGTSTGKLQRERDEVKQDLSPEWDRISGLRNERYLRRWIGEAASDTVPLGVLLLTLTDLAEIRSQYGARAAAAAMAVAGGIVGKHVKGPGRAVSLGDGTMLLLLPTACGAELKSLHSVLAAELESASTRFPFVPLRVGAVATVTRSRPLPLGALTQAARGIAPQQVALLVG